MKTLKEIREERGVKQLAAAEHLGVTRQTYAGYEENPQAMSVGQAKAISRFLHCSLEEIFFAEDVN